jgi:hypothetical protein
MVLNFKEIFDYKSVKTDADKNKILSVLNNELHKFNFEEDYLKEGSLEILSCSEIKFHTCTLENYTDTRTISETNRPNISGVAIGKKRISEFNSWDYKLTYKKEFQNSEDNHSIEESHHAIGCDTCKQHGKIRCSSCRGVGDITCSSCSGRGETQCNSCSGRGETQCWSCSGKGTKETGYGDNKRIERCSSCNGRGYKPCSSCRNGYVTCSSCSGRGRVTCYTCHGSGEVTCYECDGYRTMDHYFIVNAQFINLNQHLFVTNPFAGFDYSKAVDYNFSIQNKLFDFKENRFKAGFFEQLQAHPLFRQISIFFDFKDSEKTKLISSRITFYENRYFEVIFSFYGESYTIYLDQSLENSYYAGKKPSDQYELDLLNKSLKSANSNDLDITKKTIQKLFQYDFISINEKYLISAIEDTQKIIEAKNEIDNRNYNQAESTLRIVSDEKKNESDFKKLRKKLDRIYFKNTFIFSFLGIAAISAKLLNNDSQFILWNLVLAVSIIIICLIINRFARNINISRWLVLSLLSMQLIYIFKIDIRKKDEIKVENQKIEDFETFKKDKIIIPIDNGDESIFSFENFPRGISGEAILLDEQSNVDDFNYSFVVKPGFVEKWYRSEVKIPYLVVKEQRRVYSDDDIKQRLRNNPNPNDEIILRDWEKRLEFYAKISDLHLIEFVAVEYMFNDKESFEKNETHVVHMPKFIYDLLKQHKSIIGYNFSNIPSKSIFQSDLSQLNTNEINNNLHIGSPYQGGIIVQLDQTGEHGLIMSNEDLGDGNWFHAIELCESYSNDGYEDWVLPSINELKIIYDNKDLSNFQNNWYWSATDDPDNSNQAFHLGFVSRDQMSVPKEHGKFVRAVRKF